MNRIGPPTKLSRDSRGNIIHYSRGSTMMFSPESWEEYCNLISDFNRTGARSMQNYEDLPARTPIHVNTPTPKASLDDLI